MGSQISSVDFPTTKCTVNESTAKLKSQYSQIKAFRLYVCLRVRNTLNMISKEIAKYGLTKLITGLLGIACLNIARQRLK